MAALSWFVEGCGGLVGVGACGFGLRVSFFGNLLLSPSTWAAWPGSSPTLLGCKAACACFVFVCVSFLAFLGGGCQGTGPISEHGHWSAPSFASWRVLFSWCFFPRMWIICRVPTTARSTEHLVIKN